MFLADTWTEYQVLDTGGGEKLERWGSVILRRPDPQVIWPASSPALWGKAQAHYHRSDRGGGQWEFFEKLPDRWVLSHGDLKFYVRPTGFKHTGLFPEQSANWVWMAGLCKARTAQGKTPRILNLFGYTGGATLACAAEGGHITHVDAAKGMVNWARENQKLSKIPETSCRWIVEDALSFVKREIRRGSRYDGIVMDPPSYGRGPGGEVWKLEDELFTLCGTCAKALSDEPLFFLINSYTTGFQASVLSNILRICVTAEHRGMTDAQELCLPVETGGVLPCGCSGRWQAHV